MQKMVDSGFCTQKDLSAKVVSKMKMLSERDVLLAIEEIFNVERDKIRNFTSYLMGILNRYMRGEETPHQHRTSQGFKAGRNIKNNESNKKYSVSFYSSHNTFCVLFPNSFHFSYIFM